MFLVKKLKSQFGQPFIQVYRGFGNEEEVFVRGRVVKSFNSRKEKQRINPIKNFLTMLESLSVKGVSGVEIQISFLEKKYKVISGRSGFFELTIKNPELPVTHENWQKVYLSFLVDIYPKAREQVYEEEVLIPNTKCEYGIISDIDDTFLISYSTSTLLKLRQMFWKDILSRKSFKGTAEFYNSLQSGKKSAILNPFFFVSSSQWNLYNLLVSFCKIQGFPKGVFFLNKINKDFFKVWKPGIKKHGHKKESIRIIMATYPHLKFIFIGDSGQKDAEIYSQIAINHPERVLAIYIRDVGSHGRRLIVNNISKKLAKKNIYFLLLKDLQLAKDHALAHDFIS
ncbi:App1 family protein [Flexithrix dorotheae]|uniref:App1 family protein n=1 Tax=Flexithrix dorotheae TaxID=70993 RepID=UPI00036EC49F|nr:App1 family protein [Flexithrix dorotheae]